ncbi:STAS domain-containing protein [Pseudonocardia kujensis]|uniref:STAS domain-containing protein n=1 Tax=Pseudonocardia kujensis TaxID=1128675 RepID=UPI001E620E58|nr:STAS domain-containing protein [Pseudonocardia kujensis]MCE0763038.1 STAS domain-containing protein [Pseudonocardia kujensis]
MSSASEELGCSFRRSGDAVVLALSGPVDYTTVQQVCAALERAFADRSSRAVVLDLSEVDFLGSAGIGALVDAAKAQGDDVLLRVVVDRTRPVIRPIQLTGLDTVLALYRAREDAVRDVHRWTGTSSETPS